jgi:hypothetical protein
LPSIAAGALKKRAFHLIIDGTPAGRDGGGEVPPVQAPILIGRDLDLEEVGDGCFVSAEHAQLARLTGIFGAIVRRVVWADFGRRVDFGRGRFGRGEFPCSGGRNREFNREFLFFDRLRSTLRCRVAA